MQMPFSVVCFYCGRLFTSAARAAKGMALHFNFVKQGVGCTFMAILCTLYNYKKACKLMFTGFSLKTKCRKVVLCLFLMHKEW